MPYKKVKTQNIKVKTPIQKVKTPFQVFKKELYSIFSD